MNMQQKNPVEGVKDVEASAQSRPVDGPLKAEDFAAIVAALNASDPTGPQWEIRVDMATGRPLYADREQLRLSMSFGPYHHKDQLRVGLWFSPRLKHEARTCELKIEDGNADIGFTLKKTPEQAADIIARRLLAKIGPAYAQALAQEAETERRQAARLAWKQTVAALCRKPLPECAADPDKRKIHFCGDRWIEVESYDEKTFSLRLDGLHLDELTEILKAHKI